MTVAGQPGDSSARESRSAVASLLASAAWGVSFLTLGLIALSALWRTADLLGAVVTDFPGPYGRLGLVFTVAYLLLGVAVAAMAWRASESTRFAGLRLPLGIVGLAVAVRLVVAAVADAPLDGENLIIHAQALGVLDGACCFGHRPLGYPIALAGAYAILGVGPHAIEALNIGFAAATTWLVWEIGRVSWGRPVAAIAATAYAVVPSQVLMALVPLTEPMYTLAVAGAIRAGIALERRPMLLAAAAVAAILAAGQYVRATAASLLVPIAVLPWLLGWGLRRALLRAAVIGGLFVVLMLPAISYNLRAYGDISVSTSAYGGWSLYVGANREHGGQWNADDAARFAGFPGDSWWERSEYAGSLAVDRVLEDPGGSLALLPRKFHTVWGNETYAATYALRAEAVTRDVRVGWLLSQLAWAALAVLAAAGLLASRHDPPPAGLLIGMAVSVVAVTHLALEVHSRYHAYLVPLICILAAVGVVAGIDRWGERRRRLATG